MLSPSGRAPQQLRLVWIWLEPVGSHTGRNGFNAVGDIRCQRGCRGRSTESINLGVVALVGIHVH